MCFGYTDVDYSSYARVGAFINAPSKILFVESMYKQMYGDEMFTRFVTFLY